MVAGDFFMDGILGKYKTEAENELEDILGYWMKFAIDETNGGFIGKISHDNQKHPDAPKGSVLTSRILWSFSAAYNLTSKVVYLQVAQRAYAYLKKYFIDKEYGGVYWSVTATGEPLDTKKQIYALSFASFALNRMSSTSFQSRLKASR